MDNDEQMTHPEAKLTARQTYTRLNGYCLKRHFRFCINLKLCYSMHLSSFQKLSTFEKLFNNSSVCANTCFHYKSQMMLFS